MVIANWANAVAMLVGLDCVASNCLAMPDVRNTVNAKMVPAYVPKDGTVGIARYVSEKKKLFTNSTASLNTYRLFYSSDRNTSRKINHTNCLNKKYLLLLLLPRESRYNVSGDPIIGAESTNFI